MVKGDAECNHANHYNNGQRFGFFSGASYLCTPFRRAIYFSTNFPVINMFAIVSIAGQQFKVEEGREIFIHRLAANEGDKISFDAVHLVANGDNVTIGTPLIQGAGIRASVVGHVKGDKLIVFKKKRRKGYKVKNGHRQQFTKIKIDSISL